MEVPLPHDALQFPHGPHAPTQSTPGPGAGCGRSGTWTGPEDGAGTNELSGDGIFVALPLIEDTVVLWNGMDAGMSVDAVGPVVAKVSVVRAAFSGAGSREVEMEVVLNEGAGAGCGRDGYWTGPDDGAGTFATSGEGTSVRFCSEAAIAVV